MTASPACRLLFVIAAWCALTPLPPVWAQGAASAAAGPALQPLDIAGQLEFLRTARVVAATPIGKGVTGAKRITLSDGVRTHDAAFQAVEEESMGTDVPRALRRSGELRFVDHYRYNIAAWRLAQVLGLDYMMPPTVERSVGASGALSWWIDDVLMDEQERQQTRALPPAGALALARQFARMAVFAELVRDTDRNKGNVVFTKDWRLFMLDFTRAFRLPKALQKPAELGTCDRALLARLRTLTEAGVKDAVGSQLTGGEIAAVMARRDLLVAHFDRLIAERGEAMVLY